MSFVFLIQYKHESLSSASRLVIKLLNKYSQVRTKNKSTRSLGIKFVEFQVY